MSDSVSAIILLIGLAVGVDYTMFYLKREREERAKGRSEEAALEAAAATSGRSVLISGLHRPRRDGGHVPHGRRRLRIVRRGDDDRGRGRDARVADGSPGVALEARRQRRRGRVCRSCIGLRRDDGEGRIWGAIIDRVLRRPLVSAALAAGRSGRPRACPQSSCTRPTRASTRYPQNLLETYNRMKDGVPRHARSRPASWSRRRTSKRPRSQRRSASSSGARCTAA